MQLVYLCAFDGHLPFRDRTARTLVAPLLGHLLLCLAADDFRSATVVLRQRCVLVYKVLLHYILKHCIRIEAFTFKVNYT